MAIEQKDNCLEYMDREVTYLMFQLKAITKRAEEEEWSKENKVAQLKCEIEKSLKTIKYWGRSYE
jgi:hypothetical protein